MIGLVALGAMAATGDEIKQKVSETRALRQLSTLPEAPVIPEASYVKAASGPQTGLEVVPGHKAKKAWGVTVLDVSIEAFTAAVNDDSSKVDYTKLGYVEVLEGSLCGDKRLVFQYLPISLLTDRYWVADVRRNLTLRDKSGGRVREMTWDTQPISIPDGKPAKAYLEKGMAIEFAKGGWWLTAIDANTTLVEYWTWTDPGGYVPAGLASSFAAGGIKDTFESMAQLAKKGSKCPAR